MADPILSAEEKAALLEKMAAALRRAGLIEGPRDYVPTPEEMASERRPQIEAAIACEAGAAALRERK